LGHFDASEEIGNLDGDRVGTSTGAEHGVGDGRLGKNGKGRGQGKAAGEGKAPRRNRDRRKQQTTRGGRLE
jgi:hypothetical protein